MEKLVARIIIEDVINEFCRQNPHLKLPFDFCDKYISDNEILANLPHERKIVDLIDSKIKGFRNACHK